jgi:UDP-2,4-diacetamido-2,4,6-trideoxy-beta-L-altropyranose hydrolase
MNILIRADSSSQIGLGHIMRCLVLATQYPEDTVQFACQNLAGNILDKIPYNVHILNSNSSEELIALINTLKIDMVIFDHYDINADDEKRIKEQTSVRIMSLDDTYKPHHCDILLNHNISAAADRYIGLVPSHCELRCGNTYTLIRDEFKKEKNVSREKTYDLFIAMGGADTTNLSTKILSTLNPALNICVITTTANAHLSELLAYTLECDSIEVHVNSNEVAKLLNQSALAIITPSVMVHEVLFMNIPFVALKTADNQNDLFEYLKHHGYNAIEEWTSDSIAQFYNP